MKYVLAIDQGTTSTRAILFDANGNLAFSAQKQLKIITKKDGWVEQDAKEIWQSTEFVIDEVMQNVKREDEVVSLGITNQRETTILWDKDTGEPIYHAIVWQSRQSSFICEDWKKRGYEDLVRNKCGLIINPYFSGSKIKWILDAVEGSYERAKQKEILFGTVDSFLVWNLTRHKKHLTDVTNASRTMLFNIRDLKWDDELLLKFDIPYEILPEVVDSGGLHGEFIYQDRKIPITAIMGDQQASLFGQCAFTKGEIKNTYGTGCFALLNLGEECVLSKNSLLTTIAWKYKDSVAYALEGSIFIGGQVVSWLFDNMQIIHNFKEIDKACTVGSNGVYFIPAFVGLGAPYWDNDARGAILGLNSASTKQNIIAAAIEAIAYQTRDVMETFKNDTSLTLKQMVVDGGACKNDYLMQFQADLLGINIIRPECIETTARGAAYLSGLMSGIWKDENELKKLKKLDKVFYPSMKKEKTDKLYNKWKQAVFSTRQYK